MTLLLGCMSVPPDGRLLFSAFSEERRAKMADLLTRAELPAHFCKAKARGSAQPSARRPAAVRASERTPRRAGD